MQKLDDATALRASVGRRSDRERLLELMLQSDSEERRKADEIRPRADWGETPLSHGQERLWFLDTLGLVGSAYNQPSVSYLRGALAREILELSFRQLVDRHEILRTRFATREGVPYQLIDPTPSFSVEQIDLSEADSGEQRNHQVESYVRREQLHRFDLSTGPLIRATLLRLGSFEHILLLTTHHIISDGWSSGVMIDELGALYTRNVRRQKSELPQLAVQYADYAVWQRGRLQGERLEKLLAYWRDRLVGAPPSLLLPTDRPRPAWESFKGATSRFDLSPELSAGLKALARAEDVTLFMVLLAAFQALLFRYSGQDDIVIGSPVAGRTNEQTERLIGFFVNTLVLRTDMSGNPTFRQLLKRVKDVTLGAYAHQDLPFELLVKELRPERNLTRQPIFQVVLALQNYPEKSLSLPGIDWVVNSPDGITAHFDITLFLFDGTDRISGVFEYATDLFDEKTIDRMISHLRRLLRGITADPDSRIGLLPILAVEEENRLLCEWNDTAIPYPSDHCLHEIFAEQADRSPGATALICGQLKVSYAELDARSNHLAHKLAGLGVGPDRIVGVLVGRSVEMVVGFLGVLKAGGAYLPLDPKSPRDRLELLLTDAEADIVLTTESFAAKVPSAGRQVIFMDSTADSQGTMPRVSCYMHSRNLAYIPFTSGSTGRPRAVGVTHQNIVRLLIGNRHLRAEPTDVFLQMAPAAFDASILEIWGALLQGATLVLYPDREVDLDLLQATIEQQRVSILWLTSGLFNQVIDQRPEALLGIRTLFSGGDALSVSHVKQARRCLPDCTLINGYGPTEAATFTTCFVVKAPEALESTTPIGKPIANTRVYVLDRNLLPVPTGVVGELYIGGDGLARGYLKQAEVTAHRFVASPFSPPGSRLYRTGDLVRYLPSGDLEFLGRIDNQVKIRGFRIELGEIESILTEHEAVQQAVVLAREDSPGDRRLVSYIVPHPLALQSGSSKIEPDELRDVLVGEWATLYEETYGRQRDCAPSFIGWMSSYTGQPIPTNEMQEWLACTVARIEELRPRRALEIGCGVGLVLQHIAPACERYVGSDFSAAAIDQLRQWIGTRDDLAHVELLNRSALELRDFEAASFDTVILNSIIQYFPGIDYLLDVLREAIRLLVPGGKIFVGDVRCFEWLSLFHTGVQFSKASSTMPLKQLQRRIDRAISQDKELAVDSRLFEALPGRIPGVRAVRVQLKRGKSVNELTRYRYDVVIDTGDLVENKQAIEEVDWQEKIGSLHDFERSLKSCRWRAARIRNVPNDRLAGELLIRDLLATSDGALDVGFLRRQVDVPRGVEEFPERVWELCDLHNFDAVVSIEATGLLDVRIFDRERMSDSRQAYPQITNSLPWHVFANDPLESGVRQQLIPILRDYLKTRLPEHMIPAAWIVMKEIPLTSNGKVDRRALPSPQSRPEELGELSAAESSLESAMAEIWSQLLRVDQIGMEDNFFDLGGHSLLAIKVLFRINQALGAGLRVTDLYQNPTIRKLAAHLNGALSREELVDLSGEASLDVGSGACSGSVRVPPHAILLTGATGFVGRFLLAQLLRDTQATIYCLVRAKSRFDASIRLKETLVRWDLWSEEFDDRIVGIPGDLKLPRLGVDEPMYDRLSRIVDAIYHCATSMNHLETYSAAKTANVDSARELVKFASSNCPKVINYVSSLGVFRPIGNQPHRHIDEESPIELERHLEANGYVASKWVAEKIFLLAAERGIPCNIFRLGLVWADTTKGRFDELQREYRLLKSCLLAGVGVASFHFTMPPTPVDYVAQSIVYLGSRHSEGSNVFHISCATQMTDGFYERCNAIAATSFELLPMYEWIQRIKHLHDEGQTLPIVPLIEYAFSLDEPSFREQAQRSDLSNIDFDCQRTRRILEAAGIAEPSMNDELLRATVETMLYQDPELSGLSGSIRGSKLQ